MRVRECESEKQGEGEYSRGERKGGSGYAP